MISAVQREHETEKIASVLATAKPLVNTRDPPEQPADVDLPRTVYGQSSQPVRSSQVTALKTGYPDKPTPDPEGIET